MKKCTDIDKFMESMLKIARIGQEPDGSISRVFGSSAYEEAAKVLQEYMTQSGMQAYTDSVGNVHGLYLAEKITKEEIILGSHLDTVKRGGIYDGLLGIMAGVECVRLLHKAGQRLSYNLHIVATNGEEGNALGGTFGSRAMLGQIDLTDETYIKRAQELGYSKQALKAARYSTENSMRYLELHIEQGKTLEEEAAQLGIVTGIVGLQRYLITIKGESNHAGTTKMDYRNDALVKAAMLITLVDQKARQMGEDLVATFSQVQIEPNVLAVINNQVTLVLECRNQQKQLMEQLADYAKGLVEAMPGSTISEMVAKDPVACDLQLMELIEEICTKEEVRCLKMPSGATHDGNSFAKKMSIGMIFIPSKGGLSHCKEEESSLADIEAGIEVLFQTLFRLSE